MKQREKCPGRGCESPHLQAREGITLTEENLEKISDAYSKVYDIITEIKSL